MLDIETSEGLYEDLLLPLSGKYQAGNAAMAVGVAEALINRGVNISVCGVQRGLASVRLSGRMQVVEKRPWVVLDGACLLYTSPSPRD